MRPLLIALTLLASPVEAHAQDNATAPPPPSPPTEEARAKLIAADTDHDGRWSRAEWLAAGRRERGFDFMDTDKDGFLTPAEIKAGLERLQAMRAGQQ